MVQMGFSRANIGQMGNQEMLSQNYPIKIPLIISLKSIGIKLILKTYSRFY